jgi:MFS transporter, DHA1 family, multidrug resistance protein
MFQTCLLTFAVTLGPAIYTAGIPYVVSEFRVSTVAATVGLTAFLAGCAFGQSHKIFHKNLGFPGF